MRRAGAFNEARCARDCPRSWQPDEKPATAMDADCDENVNKRLVQRALYEQSSLIFVFGKMDQIANSVLDLWRILFSEY